MACDEGVVQQTQAPRTYAACLTALAERGLERRELERRELLRRAHALSLGAFEHRPELIHRVDSILRRRQEIHPLAAGALVAIVGCALLVGAVELSRSPQLVAFVATQKPDTQTAAFAPQDAPRISRISYTRTTEPSPAANDAVFYPSRRYRAVETKSVIPERRTETPSQSAVRLPRSENSLAGVRETTNTAAAPRDVQINVAASTSAAASSQGQEFVVLAAWGQVQTSEPRTREVADYDTGTTEYAQAAAQPNTTRAAQITFTRLILLFYPACPASGSPASATTGAKPADTTGSHSHRPTASAFDGGWLFFQL